MTWIVPERVFDGERIETGKAVLIENGRVRRVVPVGEAGTELRQVNGLLAPGFFDVQVNGGGGYLFNDTPTAEALAGIAAAHRRFGTVMILPTVITDGPAVLEAAVDAVLSLTKRQSIRGLHIEGPHISQKKRGTHAEAHIRPLDDVTRRTVSALRAKDFSVLITVAPEIVAPHEIAELVEMGAVVSLGHSAASQAETQAALKAGATSFTHLFNAMPPMEGRTPGILGAAIDSSAWCGIIADKVHVHPAMVALACRARPLPNRMVAVSDAMATVGGPDTFVLYGKTIRRNGNRLVNAEGALAGAHLTLSEALENLIAFGVEPEDALRMCRQNPVEMMGLCETGLIGLPIEDLVVLDQAYRLVSVGIGQN